jgi:hypothetical protein
MTDDLSEARLCRLEQALGRQTLCPGESCAFWERGDEHRPGGCVLDELDLAGREDVARWLTQLRERLGPGGEDATA